MCRLLTEIFLCISIAVRKFTKTLSLSQKGTDDAHFQVHAFILVHKVFACIATIILIYHSLSLAAAPQFMLCLKQAAFVPLPSNRAPSV